MARFFMLVKLLFFVYCISQCSSTEDDECPKPIIGKKTIIRTTDSINNGAQLLKKEIVENARYCYELCCSTETCNVALMHYKPNGYDEYSGEAKTAKYCYLFACGAPSVCTYDFHSRYAVIKINKPIKEEEETEAETNTIKNNQEGCPPGSPVAMCSDDPCEINSCPAHPKASCQANYCGGCHARFYDNYGNQVNCSLPVTTEAPREENSLDHNEQSVVVESTDYAEAPVDGLTVLPEKTKYEETEKKKHQKDGTTSEEDPYFSSERRTWLTDGPDDEMNGKYIRSTEITKTEQTTPVIIEYVSVVKERGLHSIPLLIALIICILFMIGLIYHFKCARRGNRVKKLPVDDGDYLINGMYL